jgi:hypothetical protein
VPGYISSHKGALEQGWNRSLTGINQGLSANLPLIPVEICAIMPPAPNPLEAAGDHQRREREVAHMRLKFLGSGDASRSRGRLNAGFFVDQREASLLKGKRRLHILVQERIISGYSRKF